MKKNIACCYLTHNHPDVVEFVLNTVQKYYDENGIDIYMYDSSTNNKTKDIVYHMINDGAKNLFYIRIDDKIGGDGKILQVLKEYGIKKHYDYIWPNKDRSYVTEKTVKKIQSISQKHYEGILIENWNPIQTDRIEHKSSYDKIEFFEKFGWLVNSWESVLFSTEMLSYVDDWKKFEQRYHLGSKNGFNQSMIFFGGLDLVKDAKVGIVNYKDVEVYNSDLASSSWIDNTFNTWGKNWPEAIKRLPSCYDKYKNKVIKDQGMHPMVFGSIDNLISLKEKGILTYKVWEDIKERWNILSDIPQEHVMAILEERYDWLILDVYKRLNNALKMKQYDTAYYIFMTTSYLKAILSYKDFWILKTCFYIYCYEIHEGIEDGLMHKVISCSDLIWKYQKMKYFVRRLEYDVQLEENMVDFCRENKVSMSFLMTVITSETLNKDKVIEKVEEVFMGK